MSFPFLNKQEKSNKKEKKNPKQNKKIDLSNRFFFFFLTISSGPILTLVNS